MYNYDNTVNYVSRMDFMNRVFAYLGIGLGLSAVGALLGDFFFSQLGGLYYIVMMIMMACEIVLAVILGRNLDRRNTNTGRTDSFRKYSK